MKSLLEEIEAEGESALARAVKQRLPEAVDLEFKGKARPENGDFEKPDKSSLGRTISAFANSAGGLLVFGVRAAKDSDGIDAATTLEPISDIDRFSSQARALVGQILLPRHDGIRIVSVKCSADPEKGYLAIQVDRSDRRPHQSKAPDDGRYYKRSGDSTFAMEHYDIEDSFKRTVSPELNLSYELSSAGRTHDNVGYIVHLRLRVLMAVENGIARSPFIHFLGHPALHALTPAETSAHGASLRQTYASGEVRYDGIGTDIFHVGVKYLVAMFRVDILVHGESGPVTLTQQPLRKVELRLPFRVGAEGARTKTIILDVPVEEMARVVGLEHRI